MDGWKWTACTENDDEEAVCLSIANQDGQNGEPLGVLRGDNGGRCALKMTMVQASCMSIQMLRAPSTDPDPDPFASK